MILDRPLATDERRRSQRLYGGFNFVNGMSYMCLGENLQVLFAAQLGAPNAVVALLGAMQFIGYAALLVGVRHTARRGAAASPADFWVARSVAALLTASAALVWRVSPPGAWLLLLFGALLFQAFRAAGSALFIPLVGDISTEDEAPGVIGSSMALFNISSAAMLAAITAATGRWHGRDALAAVIVLGSLLGFASSVPLRRIDESGAIRDAARGPLLRGMRDAFRASAGVGRLTLAWFFLNLQLVMLLPVATLALKRGCGFSDFDALLCACAQFLAGIAASFANGPLCRRFGTRRVLVASAVGLLAVPFAWLAIPATAASGRPAVAAGLVLFLWLGGVFNLFCNAISGIFLEMCPDKKNQVAGSIAVNFVSGAGAGIAGSVLGAWLVTKSGDWAAAIGGAAFAGPAGPFRLYFLLLLPPLAATLAATVLLHPPAKDH